LWQLQFVPDGSLYGIGHGNLRRWNAVTGKNLPVISGYFRGAAISPAAKTVAGFYQNSVVELWDVATDKQKYVFASHREPPSWLAFSQDGKTLISEGGALRVC